MFANCILFATFCSMGTLVRRKKTWRYSARKVMEFGQLMINILVYVSCKFEMYNFKIAQVISENVRIAFLYVLSIFYWPTRNGLIACNLIPIIPVILECRSNQKYIFVHFSSKIVIYLTSERLQWKIGCVAIDTIH